MHDALFGVQPAEGGPGLSDAELVELGGTAGVTGEDFGSCVTSLQHERFTQRATEAASKARVVQTPTVLVNGAPLLNPTVDALRAASAASAASAAQTRLNDHGAVIIPARPR